MKNEKGIEELLAELLRSSDRQAEILSILAEGQKGLIEGQNSQTKLKLLSLLNDKMEGIDENRKTDSMLLQGSLARIENELRALDHCLKKP